MFQSIPTNFQSLFSELVYSFSTTSDRDITISIMNSQTNELLGLKCFYSTSTAQINVAPIVRNYALPQPTKTVMGFAGSDDAGFISIHLRESDSLIESESRIFLFSNSDSTNSEILSTIPLQRAISVDEIDMVALRCEPNSNVTAIVEYYAYGTYEPIYTRYYECNNVEYGVATFCFRIDPDFVEQTLGGTELEQVNVSFAEYDSQGELMLNESMNYIVIDPPTTPVRVAWIGSAGAVEHYTFPIIREITRCSDGQVKLLLASALETPQMREALAQIVSSPMVWIDREQGYEQVEVNTESLTIVDLQQLGSVELSIICSDLLIL